MIGNYFRKEADKSLQRLYNASGFHSIDEDILGGGGCSDFHPPCPQFPQQEPKITSSCVNVPIVQHEFWRSLWHSALFDPWLFPLMKPKEWFLFHLFLITSYFFASIWLPSPQWLISLVEWFRKKLNILLPSISKGEKSVLQDPLEVPATSWCARANWTQKQLKQHKDIQIS